MRRQRIGLIVNPVAGMGGRVGLKGTDGLDILAEARRRGAVPEAGTRTRRALARLAPARDRILLLAAAGAMGEEAARAEGFDPEIVGSPAPETFAEHTRSAARAMLGLRADLVLFAGGDGTARDLHSVLADAVPMLGIPTGVKMHSAVFAASPEAAGWLLARFAGAEETAIAFRASEIMDIDEQAVRSNRTAARLYGYARVPYERHLVQNAKAAGYREDEAAVAAAGREMAAAMEAGVTYVVGPGSSAKQVLVGLGISGTLLGVDVVRNRALLGRDLSEGDILALCKDCPVRIVVGVIGGQGFLFGRGNHPIGPELIRQAGRDGIIVIAGRNKLASLPDRRLLVDTGDPELDRELAGYLRVVTGPGETMVVKVSAGE